MTASTLHARGLPYLWSRAPVAVAGVGVTATLGVASVLAAVAGADGVGKLLATVVFALGCLLCVAAGALILVSLPGHGLGVVLVLGGSLGSLWALAVPLAEDVEGLSPTVVSWAAWVENWAFTGLMVLVTWPLLLFPDGRLPSRRWRPFAIVLAAGIAAIALRGMLDPGTLDDADTAVPVANPLGVPATWTWVNALGVLGLGFPLGVIASMVAVHRRTAGRTDAPTRAVRWAARLLGANFVLWIVLTAAFGASDGAIYAVTFTVAVGGFGLVAAYALVRHRSVEVDQLLRRAFLTAGLSAALLAVFGGVFALIAALAGDRSGVALAGLAALAAAIPLRSRLQTRLDTSLWGHGDPRRALSQVRAELDAATDPDAAVAGLAEAVRGAVGAAWCRIEPDASIGLPPAGIADGDPVYDRELVHTTRVGRLLVGGRTPGEPFGVRDLELLDLLAGQVALALGALGLAVALSHSRGEIVTAREEERRRLRRDLHDELGPALAGVALTLEAAQNGRDDELLLDARRQTQAIVGDIRRIVHGLRPPMLDELGLAAALRVHAERLRPLVVELHVPDPAPPISAAAELAVYRIATEALTNVVRHAQARRATVSLEVGSRSIELRIRDDGRGFPDRPEPGVGLRSMSERAAELEGSVAFSRAPQGGAEIMLSLPR